MAATLGVLNPFRYRGYIYDEETGYYYLRSRYYYPNRGRFINADTLIKSNIFAYCDNSPILCYDSLGRDCRKCSEGVAVSADRYVLNNEQASILSQWFTSTHPYEELTPLIDEIIDGIIPNLIDTGVSEASDIALPAVGKFASALSLANAIYEPIKYHESDTTENVKDFFQSRRSDHAENYGCIIDVFAGSTEIVLSITVITCDGEYSKSWIDRSIWDGTSQKGLANIVSFLEETFIPTSHGHPDPWVTYAEYSWK